MLIIENKHREVANTNFWDSPEALIGLCFLSRNAGVFRLLVPDSEVERIRRECIDHQRQTTVTRGMYNGRDAMEILFEDGSQTPFVLIIGTEQVDLLPSNSSRDRRGQPHSTTMTLWTRQGKLAEFPCRYRLATTLPCLRKWE